MCLIRAGGALGLLLAPGLALGSGYALIERDAAGLGRAYAGQAAVREAAALSFNPAALPDAGTVGVSLHGVHNDIQPEDAGETAWVPTLYLARNGLGAGVYASFGLATDYPDDWSGRYRALRSEIRTARVQLAGSRTVSPTLRLGAGIFVQHFAAELSNAVPTRAGDGRLRVAGTDQGMGGLAGLWWSPRSDLELGLAVASAVHHELRGSGELPPGSTAARVRLTTPESLTLGGRWAIAPEWALFAGAAWTRWSRLDTLDVRLSNGLTLTEEYCWRDTWRLDLGTEYRRGAWRWRAGTAWDQSPIRDAAHRGPRLPDSDRTWLALGVGYERDAWRVDLGYAHLWFAGGRGVAPPVDHTIATDVLAVGLTWRW